MMEVAVTSSTAVQYPRGQLLAWINNLLKLSISKIQQLGTGSAYCQMLDVLYPGKVQISKVNWKAKFEYEFIANFKVLQQGFLKVGLTKHIDVERLVKCKVQDNLEFLQWFRKHFDFVNGGTAKEYDAVAARKGAEIELNVGVVGSVAVLPPRAKQQQQPLRSLSINNSNIHTDRSAIHSSKGISRDRHQQNQQTSNYSQPQQQQTQAEQTCISNSSFEQALSELHKLPLGSICTSSEEAQLRQLRQELLTKLKKIQNLVSTWESSQTGIEDSHQLAQSIQDVISSQQQPSEQLMTPIQQEESFAA